MFSIWERNENKFEKEKKKNEEKGNHIFAVYIFRITCRIHFQKFYFKEKDKIILLQCNTSDIRCFFSVFTSFVDIVGKYINGLRNAMGGRCKRLAFHLTAASDWA